MFVHAHVIQYRLHNFILNVDFLPTVSAVFLLEYTVMLLLTTSVKVRSTRTYMCEISSILLKFCARFWQFFSKNFVIPPQISPIHLNFYHMKRVATLIFCRGNSMSNHPWHDTFTSQILFIFSLFLDSVEMINPWRFQPSPPYSYKVIEIWKFA